MHVEIWVFSIFILPITIKSTLNANQYKRYVLRIYTQCIRSIYAIYSQYKGFRQRIQNRGTP